jgi:hypothetical protein
MPLNRPRGIADADSNPSAAVPIGALYARTFAGNSCARITAISRLFEPQSARSRRARMRRESACERIRSRYRRGKEKALGQSVVARDRRQRDGNVEMSRMPRSASGHSRGESDRHVGDRFTIATSANAFFETLPRSS